MKKFLNPGFIASLILIVTLSSCLPASAETSGDPTSNPAGIDAILQVLPPSTQAAIKGDLPNFKALLADAFKQDPELIRLVDKHHTLAADYTPADLVMLNTVKPKLALNNGNVPLQLRKVALSELQAMIAAAHKAGIILDISSAYRSFQYQIQLFNRYVKADGKAAAERYSAHAGASQHQLGLAMDFGSVTAEFAQTKAGRWLSQHAGEFGYSLSYPDGQEANTGYMYEPWHYRFIGFAAAALQQKYFNGSQQDLLVFLDARKAALKLWATGKQ